MKRKLLGICSIILVFVALIGLTACDDKNKENNEKKEEAISSPEKVVESFLEYVENGELTKASKLVDWTFSFKTYDEGYYSYYDDFDFKGLEDMSTSEINEYKEDKKSDIENAKNSFEDYSNSIKNMNKFKIRSKVENGEKEDNTKNIYEVSADVKFEYQEKENDKEDTLDEEIDFYIIEKNGKYYIIDGVYDVKKMISDMYW